MSTERTKLSSNANNTNEVTKLTNAHVTRKEDRDPGGQRWRKKKNKQNRIHFTATCDESKLIRIIQLSSKLLLMLFEKSDDMVGLSSISNIAAAAAFIFRAQINQIDTFLYVFGVRRRRRGKFGFFFLRLVLQLSK